MWTYFQEGRIENKQAILVHCLDTMARNCSHYSSQSDAASAGQEAMVYRSSRKSLGSLGHESDFRPAAPAPEINGRDEACHARCSRSHKFLARICRESPSMRHNIDQGVESFDAWNSDVGFSLLGAQNCRAAQTTEKRFKDIEEMDSRDAS
jgi:hypothetical protein